MQKLGMIKIKLSKITFASVCIGILIGYDLLHQPFYKNLLEVKGFFNEKEHFVPLKIKEFSRANIPELEIKIENTIFTAKVDFGWQGGVLLPPFTMETIKEKSFVNKETSYGLRGKFYERDIYEVPQVFLGNLCIFPMRIAEENLDFSRDAVLKKGEKEINEDHLGTIGWCVFKPFNVLLDCEHSAIVACDSLDTLKKQGYPTDSFIEAPLLLDRRSLDVEVMTEAGPLRCTLDTGATWNLLNKDFDHLEQGHRFIDLKHLMNENPTEFNSANEDLLIFNPEDEWETKTFQMNGKEFGPVNFVKIKSPLGLDAILGMEFIEDHLIFIDFKKEKIYFSKLPDERSLFVRAYDFILHKMQKVYFLTGGGERKSER